MSSDLSDDERLMLDVTKLHTEIANLVNMRIWVALGVTTVLGVIGRDLPSATRYVGANEVIIDLVKLIVLTTMLLALLISTVGVWKRIRTYSTYLRVHGHSDWEAHWLAFRTPEQVPENETRAARQARCARERTRREFSRLDTRGFGATFIAAGIVIVLLASLAAYRYHHSFGLLLPFPAHERAAIAAGGGIFMVLCFAYAVYLWTRLIHEPRIVEVALERRWSWILSGRTDVGCNEGERTKGPMTTADVTS